MLQRWGRWVRSVKGAGVFDRALADPMIDVQKLFLRKVAGVKHAPNKQLFAEMSQLPLHHFWAQQVFGFWKRVSKQTSSLARAVLVEDVKAWLESDHTMNEHEYFWSGKVLRILRSLGFDYRSSIESNTDKAVEAEAIVSLEIPFDTVLEEFRRRLLVHWDSPDMTLNPRVYPEGGTGVTACRYLHWMGVVYSAREHKARLSHLGTCIPRAHHVALMRFRLGCWNLDVSRFARKPGRKARTERKCRACGSGEVENERHVLMECQVYEPLRVAAGFQSGVTCAML